ncbi:hypothetical protein [Streptomyces sp. NPDC017095]|uniref:hypothetical protein n=1 Tax=Streptomyces sp. NPDC017095 TaxID=3364977 RepID=UPI00378DA896
MGWAVLYIAFGGVALWLLGEVLLQYKARLRWRLLAFAGFAGVVAGVLLPSVIVIGVGAIAFAVGQTYVTLSFRRGFASGWAVKRPGAGTGGGSKRRRGRTDRQTAAPQDPGPADEQDNTGRPAYGQETGHGTDHPVYGQAPGDHDGFDRADGFDRDDFDRDDVFTPAASRADGTAPAETTAVYEPLVLPEDPGGYTGYGDPAQQAPAYEYPAYGRQQDYGYDTTGRPQGYANYSDPYIGTQSYGGYDQGYGEQYGQQPGYAPDPYAPGGYPETPPGGVWVPQQRTDDSHGGELPQEQPYPQPDGHRPQPGAGYDEQYRF